MNYTLTDDMRVTDGEHTLSLAEIVVKLNDNGTVTEDSAEVESAARALAAYYDGDDADWDTWVAGAVVALNASRILS